MNFNVIVADPPWPSRRFGGIWRAGRKETGWSGLKYNLMSIEEIVAYKMPHLTPTAVLFLWRLSSMQQEALDVCRAWGFRPYGEIVWHKKTTRGKDHFGMGMLLRGAHETCLVGVRKVPKPVKHTRDLFEAVHTGRHSGKPEAFYDLVEKLLPGPYLELFARRKRRGWTCRGAEL